MNTSQDLELLAESSRISVDPVEIVWLLDCGLLDPGEAPHEFRGDWIFGGADGCHPGADPRFQTTVYRYLDAYTQTIWTTCAPTCDHLALDQFTLVSSFGDFHPIYLEALRPGKTEFELLPWEYRESTDTIHPLVSVNA